MRITPRKAERNAVMEILEKQHEYETLDDLAEDLIECVADLFSERDWYAFGTNESGIALAYGPLSSETEVKRFAEKVQLGPARGVKLYSTARALRNTGDV